MVRKKIKEDFSSLEERARNNGVTEEDCEFIAGMVETIEFIRNNLDKDEAELKQLLKENLDAKPEKFLRMLLGTKTG